MRKITRLEGSLIAMVLITAGVAASAWAYQKHQQSRYRIKAASCVRSQFAPPVDPKQAETEQERLWAFLKPGGHIVLLRHADTQPNTKDAAEVSINDCSTQRPLSETGRQKAQAIGKAFRDRDIPISKVLTSQFCRTRDTAKLAFKEFTDEPDLNFLPADASRQKAQTAALRKLVASKPENGNLVLVTHSVNIEALLGLAPDMGEAVILSADEKDGYKVLGRLAAWKDPKTDR